MTLYDSLDIRRPVKDLTVEASGETAPTPK
jgi:hypothetical protein